MIKKYRFIIALAAIGLTALLSYSNTFFSPFLFDDIAHIAENDKIQNLSNSLHSLEERRYVGELSFALNYHFGGLNVFGYHLVNFVIHLLNGLLVWWLVTLTFRTPAMSCCDRRDIPVPHSEPPFFIALGASLIFISHPVQTQAVTYLIQRFASLATLFYVLSLVLYVQWRLSSGGLFKIIFYLFSVLSAVLAMKSKEISFTLPFVILLYEFIFLKDRRRMTYLLLVPFLLTLYIVPSVTIGTDESLTDIVGELKEAAQEKETEAISRGTYLFTQFRVIVTYIRLLFIPVNQNVDYDYPLYHSLFTPAVFLSFLFLLSLFCLALYLFIRSRKSGNGYLLLISFGILWFFITLSLESSIIPIRDVIFEHRLYLPSVGAMIAVSAAVAYGLWYGRERGGIPVPYLRAISIFLLITVVPLSLVTYQRNKVWKNEITLWEDVVKKSPFKARGHHNLGVAYSDQGRIYDAINELRTTLRLKPDNAEAHINLGVIYSEEGRIEEAIEEFNTTLRLNPGNAKAHNNLGVAYNKQGRTGEAIAEFREVLRLKPKYAMAHVNLGIAYQKEGRIGEAITEFREALRLRPGSVEASKRLALAYNLLKSGER